jgi:hypothetical protein
MCRPNLLCKTITGKPADIRFLVLIERLLYILRLLFAESLYAGQKRDGLPWSGDGGPGIERASTDCEYRPSRA